MLNHSKPLRHRHDLSTAGFRIIGAGHLLRSLDPGQDERDLLATIEISANALLTQINEVLDFSRSRDRAIVLDRDPVDLCSVLSEVWLMLHQEAERKGLAFRVRVDCPCPRYLISDARRLLQVLVNLVGNAIKFTAHGEIRIEVATAYRAQGGSVLELAVADTGIGIPADKLEVIFHAFTQADEGVQRRFGGSGLGLAICRQIVRAMGGTIVAHSIPGGGSRFVCQIPFGPVDAPLSAQVSCPVVLTGDWAVAAGSPSPSVLASFSAPNVCYWTGGGPASGADGPAAIDDDLQGHLVLIRDPDSDGSARHFFELYGRHPRLVLVHAGADAPARQTWFGRWASTVVVFCSEDGVPEALSFAAAMERRCRSRRDLSERPDPTRPCDLVRRFSGKAVLLVEDNATNRRVIGRILRHAGLDVVEAGTADEALARFSDVRVDLVLMDVNLPGTSGIEIATSMLGIPAPRLAVPIVALTADASDVVRHDCLAAGMCAFLTKPVAPALLLDVIARFLGPPDAVPGPAMRQRRSARSRTGPVDPSAVDALVSSGIDRVYLSEVVAGFYHDAQDLVGRMREAVASGDAVAFRNAAHALKGSAGYLGAYRLMDMVTACQDCPPSRFLADEVSKLGAIAREIELIRLFFVGSGILTDGGDDR